MAKANIKKRLPKTGKNKNFSGAAARAERGAALKAVNLRFFAEKGKLKEVAAYGASLKAPERA